MQLTNDFIFSRFSLHDNNIYLYLFSTHIFTPIISFYINKKTLAFVECGVYDNEDECVDYLKELNEQFSDEFNADDL